MYKYFLLFIVSFSFGQVPYSKDNLKNTLSIKGFGYINLLDGGFGSIVGPAIGFVFGNVPGWSIDTQISYLTGKKDKSTNFEGVNEYTLKETYSTNYFRFEFLVAYNFDF